MKGLDRNGKIGSVGAIALRQTAAGCKDPNQGRKMPGSVEGSGQSFSVLSEHPRPGDWIVIDGRSPGLRISDDHLPSRDLCSQWRGLEAPEMTSLLVAPG